MLVIIFPSAAFSTSGAIVTSMLECLLMNWNVALLDAKLICPQRIYSMQGETDRGIWRIKGIDDECCAMTKVVSSYQDLRN